MLTARLRLVALEGIKVEDLLLLLDVLPSTVLSCSLLQFLKSGAVGGQEDEGVGMVAGTGTPLLQDGRRFKTRRTRYVFCRVDVHRPQEYKPGIPLIWDLAARCREGVNAGEAAPRTLLSPQPLLDQRQDFVTVVTSGPVL